SPSNESSVNSHSGAIRSRTPGPPRRPKSKPVIPPSLGYDLVMPAHNWTRVSAGTFHSFHLGWIAELTRALNGGLLPPDYYALAEQRAAEFESDILALERLAGSVDESNGAGESPSASQSNGGGTA